MQVNQIDISYHAILPETITSVVAIAIMLIDAFARRIERRVAGVLSLLGLAGAGAALYSRRGQNGAT